MYAAAQAAGQVPSAAALSSDEESLQHGQRSTRGNQRSSAASRPISRAVHSSSRPVCGAADMGLTGNSRPVSGRLQISKRPISALLNGSKELADLVSVSKPRYTDQSAAPSLEPSAEVLHGQYVCCRVHVVPASQSGALLQ